MPTWARATVELDVDGNDLVRQTRVVAEKAGNSGGKTFNAEFAKSLVKNSRPVLKALNDLVRSSGRTWVNLLPRQGFWGINQRNAERFFRGVALGSKLAKRGLRDAWQETKRAAPAFREFFGQAIPSRSDVQAVFGEKFVRNIERTGSAITRMLPNFQRLKASTEDTATATQNLLSAMKKLLGTFRRTPAAADGVAKSGNKINKSWKTLPFGFRQAVFWTGLVVAGFGQTAVLGSALAGTAVALGAGFLALGGAAVFAVAGFKGLFEEGAKLNKGAQASKEAFQGLGEVFKDLQGSIVNSMFGPELAKSVEGFGKGLKSIEPAIKEFANATGFAIKSLFDAFSQPAALKVFAELLKGFGPILQFISTIVSSFALGLLNVFAASLPFAEQMFLRIAQVGQAFQSWTESEAGRERLAEFFKTAATIMPPLVNLIVQVGKSISGLVNQDTASGLLSLIESLTSFVPVLQTILQITSNLNVFGLLAQAFDVVGQALTPILPSLEELGTLISSLISGALSLLGPLIQQIATAFAPFLTTIIAVGTTLSSTLFPVIQPLVETIGGLAAKVISALLPAFNAILPMVINVTNSLTPLINSLGPILTGVIDALLPLLTKIINSLVQVAVAIAPLITSLLPPLSELFAAVVEVVIALLPVIDALIDPILALIPPLVQLVKAILPILVTLFVNVAGIVKSFLLPIIKALTPVIAFLADVIKVVLIAGINILIGVIKTVASWFIKWQETLKPVANFLGNVLGKAIDVIRRAIEGLINPIKNAIDWFGRLFNSANEAGGASRNASSNGRARGGILRGPMRVLAGEAGPEAIVPLNRPLSQVDPSVRWLSAVAQGKSTQGMANGGMVGGKTVTIEAGAVQIQGAMQPERAAALVVNRLAQRIAG